MWTRRVLRSAGCAVAMSILLAPLVAGTADQPGEPATEHARGGDSAARGRSPLLPGQSGASKIANQVIDLVDGAVSLDTEASRARWESEPFRTGQANRIGLRVRAALPGAQRAGSGGVLPRGAGCDGSDGRRRSAARAGVADPPWLPPVRMLLTFWADVQPPLAPGLPRRGDLRSSGPGHGGSIDSNASVQRLGASSIG